MQTLLAYTLREDSNVIDVGAHLGDFLAGAVRLAPRGQHVAFEPLPGFASALRTRFPNVEVHETALAAQAGDSTFNFVRSRPGYSGLRPRDYPGTETIDTIAVRVARLDDIVTSAPRLIKIDVEGGELGVLEGASRLLKEYRPIVVFEHGRGAAEYYDTQPADVHSLLSSTGHRIFDLEGRGPYSRGDFERAFAHNTVWNWVAH